MRTSPLVVAVLTLIGLCVPVFDHAQERSGAASTPKSVTTALGALAYFKSGAGPAVVIVHGIGGHKEDWMGLSVKLAPTHTVYAVDMLGFGGSAKTGSVITIAD